MRGFRTLWQMGSDHAGIATEMVVGRNLALEGKGETRDSLGRDAFIEKVWEWKAQSGGTIERQMRRIGTSGDWSRSVFTMDPMPPTPSSKPSCGCTSRAWSTAASAWSTGTRC